MTVGPVDACEECGNDEPCEGYRYCSDCLEELGHLADEGPTMQP